MHFIVAVWCNVHLYAKRLMQLWWGDLEAVYNDNDNRFKDTSLSEIYSMSSNLEVPRVLYNLYILR